MPLVRYLGTRIAVMERGRLLEMGEAEAMCAARSVHATVTACHAGASLQRGVIVS
jgi:ABC-type glutathione transport system ATPase component